MGIGDTTSSEQADLGGDAALRDCAGALLPIVRVGVTGHRDPVDPISASRLVTEAFVHVLNVLEAARRHRRLPALNRSAVAPLAFQVVSPLAEGADRVVAGLVTSDDATLSARPRELAVPLPFGLASYRGSEGSPGTDCTDESSQHEFDELYQIACWTQSLHAQAPATGPQRDAWYRDVGEFVVEHSDVLVALWDGYDNSLEAGTAAVVRLALRRGMHVIWIPTVRKAEPDSVVAGQQFEGPRLLSTGAAASADLYAAVRASLDLYSSQATAALTGRPEARYPLQVLLLERLARLDELLHHETNGAARQDLATDVSGIASDGSRAREVLTATSRWIEPPYQLADGLAGRYQFRLRMLTIGVYSAAATAVAFGALAAILFPFGGAWNLAVVLEAVVLIALLAVQWLDLRKTYRDRWVAFRALSEYMRIGRYLALVTPTNAPGLDFNRVVRLNSWSSDPSLTPWFAPVLERLWARRPDVRLADRDVGWLRDIIVHDWIDSQIRFHAERHSKHRMWDRNLRWAISATLLATVVTVAMHALRDYVPSFLGPQAGARDLTSVTLAFLVIVLTSVAAAFNGYAAQQRHSYHQERFRRMARELRTIRDQIHRAGSIDQLRLEITQIRRVTLGEATDWFEDMRDQQLDSPV